MPRIRRLLPSCIALAAYVAFGITVAPRDATASLIQVRDGNGGSVFSGGPGSVNLTIRVDGSNRNVAAGAFALQYRESSGSPWIDFLTYCLEPDEALGITGSTPVSGDLRSSLAGTAEYGGRAAALTGLWNTWFADSLTSAVRSAAFQVALWEIAYDDGASDLGGGKLRYTTAGNVLTQANAYLNAANWNNPAGDPPGVILRVGNQDLVVTVPEPATLALFGLGLIGLAGVARRRVLHG